MQNDMLNGLKIAQPFCKEVKAGIQNILAGEREHAYIKTGESLFNITGKMLRPSLVYLSVLSAQKEEIDSFENFKKLPCYEKVLDFAVAVELLHQASITHDDILDEEDLRRGEAAIHKKFGLKTALLSGNILYLLSFWLSLEKLSKSQSEALVKAALSMCRGEVAQLSLMDNSKDGGIEKIFLSRKQENESLIEKEHEGLSNLYAGIIAAKTGELTAISCREPIRIAGFEEEKIAAYEGLGRTIGILYQILDDLEDRDTWGVGERYAKQLFFEHFEEVTKRIQGMHQNQGKEGFSSILQYFSNAYQQYQQKEGKEPKVPK